MLTVRVLCPWPANQEVIRLDIPVDEVLLMHRLYPGQLHGDEARSDMG